MSKFLYDIFLALYTLGVRVAAIWNPKAKQWLRARNSLFDVLISSLSAASGKQSAKDKLIWMHCASLGEFEQGRPLLESIRMQYPHYRLLLSFFSPSGYEVMKDYSGADHVFYLPMDSYANANKFIDTIDPSIVLWVKYEFWYYYLHELNKRQIPVILLSGIFRPGQPFFKWYGPIWRKMLGCFTHLFVQNQQSGELLRTLGLQNRITVSGDTRFDRVISIAGNFEPIPLISEFCGLSSIIVAGSTWEEDEIELQHFISVHPELKFIIAPHEIHAANLERVKKMFPGSRCYSALAEVPSLAGEGSNVLIIDNIGMLSRLYHYATITYVGGGFGEEGVHNTLEPAIYGKPVVFGPEYEKFAEAQGLVEAGGGISFNLPLGLEEIFMDLLNDEKYLQATGTAAKDFVLGNQGATQKIMDYFQENRLLTS